jgi:hypothetical protein
MEFGGPYNRSRQNHWILCDVYRFGISNKLCWDRGVLTDRNRLKKKDEERNSRSLLYNAKEFIINQIHQVEQLDEDDLEILIKVIKALNKENPKWSGHK